MSKKTPELNRRGFMKATAAGAFIAGAPTIFTSKAYAGYLNDPGSSSSVTLGFNVPQSGPYADEGADELRAYKLAVEHLNGGGDGGMLNTFSSKKLTGAGVLGKEVKYVTGDTQTKSDQARASARAMIEKEGAVMITGLCQEAGIIFMAGLTHSNDTTGKDRKANGFRHFFNSYMSGAALAPVLGNAYGKDRKAYHLTADYNWGYTTEEAVTQATEAMGWETVNTVKTPLKETDFSSYIAPVLQSDADVLVLNHYGGNMVNSLTNAVQFGLRDKVVNGKNFEIVVPLYSRFGEKYGFPPSQAAHTCYVQTLLYADACERAGSFDPCAVVEALEGFEFDGMGNGKTLYRAEDHQCFKDVLVVKGKENPTSEFDLLEIVEVTPVDQVMYEPNHPQMGGAEATLGSCNNVS